MVWQWQRNRGHRGRTVGGDLAPETPGPLADPEFVAGLRPIPVRSIGGRGVPGGTSRWPASDLAGVSPTGTTVAIDLVDADRPLLLAFLATRCDGCQQFWDGLRNGEWGGLPGPVSVAAVTRGPESIAPSEVAGVAHDIVELPVVMSDQAWADYRVLGYPFFVLIDPVAREVIGETVGFGWPDVASMISAALPAER